MKTIALCCSFLAAVAGLVRGATPAWPTFRGPNCSGVAADARPPVKIGPTHAVLWKVPLPFSPSSPCIWGDQLFVTAFEDNELQTRCYQRTDGRLAWTRGVKVEKLERKNKDGVIALDEFEEISRDGRVEKSDYDLLVASMAKGENVLLAIKPGGRGNITQSHIAWKATRGLPYVASPLLYDGRLYCFKNGGMISSFDAQIGKAFYLQERLNAEGSYYSSPVAADGRIYVASVPGKLTVIKAGGDKPEILHRVEFGERIHSSPAIAGNNLYLRTQSALYAFGEPAGP